eukprot:7106493-Pyramimonas_sp.AAC.1
MWAAVVFKNGAAAILVSAHAPTECSSEAQRLTFFDQVNKLLSELRAKFPTFHTIAMIDGNARIGSVPSKYIGGCDAHSENANGSELRHLLDTFDAG